MKVYMIEHWVEGGYYPLLVGKTSAEGRPALYATREAAEAARDNVASYPNWSGPGEVRVVPVEVLP